MPRGRTTGRGARLRKLWAGILFEDDVVTTTQAVITSIASGLDNTVLRIRGNVLIVATPNAAGDSDNLCMGFAVVTDNAASASGAAVPSPVDDLTSDIWLWHQVVPLNAAGATAIANDSIGSVIRVEIDSKAMRKMPPGKSLALIAELETGEMASVLMVGGWRALFGS